MTGNKIKPAIEVWPIERLVPYEKNAKKHPREQIEALKKALMRRWTQPLIVQRGSGRLIAGHGRRLACLELIKEGHDAFQHIPVIAIDCTDAEADAMRLEDNRVASTEYDLGLVQEELHRLFELGVDLDSTGYDAKEIDIILSDMGEINTNALIEDISAEVERQKTENGIKEEQVEHDALTIAKAFGFAKVTVAQARRIKEFMIHLRGRGNADDLGALLAHIDSVLKA